MRNDISMSDILFDMVNSILLSEYKDLFVYRGAFALSNLLRQEKLGELAKSTTDVDVIFRREDRGVWRKFYSECSRVLTENSKLRLKYVNDPEKDHGKGHSWKHGYVLFDVYVPERTKSFKTRIDFKEDKPFIGLQLVVPELLGSPFAVAYEKMLIDKACNMQWDTVLQRYKDIYDVYCLSFIKDYKMDIVIDTWANTKDKKKFMPTVDTVIFFTNCENLIELEKYFEIYTDELELEFPISFTTFYARVSEFVTPIYATCMGCGKFSIWNSKGGFWE